MPHDQGPLKRDESLIILAIVGGALTFAILLAIWMALAGRLDEQDLIGGAGATSVAVVAGFIISHNGRALPAFRCQDAKVILILPWRVIVETGKVFAIAGRTALGHGATVGAWSTVAIEPGEESPGWPAARRDAVVTALMSASPTAIVANVDAEAGTALIHKLVQNEGAQTLTRPEVSALMKEAERR